MHVGLILMFCSVALAVVNMIFASVRMNINNWTIAIHSLAALGFFSGVVWLINDILVNTGIL